MCGMKTSAHATTTLENLFDQNVAQGNGAAGLMPPAQLRRINR